MFWKHVHLTTIHLIAPSANTGWNRIGPEPHIEPSGGTGLGQLTLPTALIDIPQPRGQKVLLNELKRTIQTLFAETLRIT